MAKLTLECWTRGRMEYLTILLASLHNQTFQDWDLIILEEADCNYLGDPMFVGMIRRIKNQGHKVVYMHPRNMLGCVESAVKVMSDTTTKYAMKLDDDHVFEIDALEKMVEVLDNNDDIVAVGGMLYPMISELNEVDEVPADFNRWTGEHKRIWNDYTTLTWKFPEQLVEVDFLRAPFMYRADLLRETDFLQTYNTLGYSRMAHRIESEITNTIQDKFPNTRKVVHTGVNMWHYFPQTGGCRMIPGDVRIGDDELYYSRWGHLHGDVAEGDTTNE